MPLSSNSQMKVILVVPKSLITFFTVKLKNYFMLIEGESTSVEISPRHALKLSHHSMDHIFPSNMFQLLCYQLKI